MKKHAAPILAAILLLLPVLYVLSYIALVLPEGRRVRSPNASYSSRWDVFYYRLDNSRVGQVFWPLEQIDRKLRPRAWKVKLEKQSDGLRILPSA